MTTLKTIIDQEHRQMLKAGIVDATREEALGYLVWRAFRREPWRLFRVIHWVLRYADYHQEAVDIDDMADKRLSSDCAVLRWSERRKRLAA